MRRFAGEEHLQRQKQEEAIDNEDAQSNERWVEPANKINGGIGVFAGAVENLSRNARTGSEAKLLGHTTLVIGTGLDAIGVYNYYTKGANNPNAVSPTNMGTNLGVGAWGMINPATAACATLYFLIDNLYPNGFNGAMQMNSSLNQQNQAILGTEFNLYKDY